MIKHRTHVENIGVDHLQRQESDCRLKKFDVCLRSDYMNDFIDSFIGKLNELTPNLNWDNINSGSYYEKTKVELNCK